MEEDRKAEQQSSAGDRGEIFGVIALWAFVWLVLAWALEQVRQGFVVNWINIKWVVVLFMTSGLIYLILKMQGSEPASQK